MRCFGALLFLTGVILCQAVTIYSQEICIPENDRVNCHPEPFLTEQKCTLRGCTYCPPENPDSLAPACFFPNNYGYYITEEMGSDNGFMATLRRIESPSLYGRDSELLVVHGYFESDYRLRIKIMDVSVDRYEVPILINKPSGNLTDNRLYNVELVSEPFAIRVTRKSTNEILFDTSLGGFTYSDQFIQFTTKVPSKNVYGIGENEQPSFRHNFDEYRNWALFARDQPPDYNANMYGVHPYYTVLENSGHTHSVAIINSNAQEFTLLPTPAIQYRTIGGILDLYYFFGPTPEEVVQQYTEAVGRASIPPMWALGFQLCKYGYNTLENMKAVVERTAAAKIPHDVQYGDIDIMDRELDFTISQDRFGGLAEYVKELKTKGIKFITILDPCISIAEEEGTYPPFDSARDKRIWVEKADGTPVTGKVWPAGQTAPVYFPDYSKEQTRSWWIEQIVQFKKNLDFDALWIDMNEPANFVAGDLYEGCDVNSWNNPPYVPRIQGNYLPDKTVCMDHKDSISIHYNTHSLFGWFQSEPTLAGVKAAHNYTKRAFILSRSTFLGSGKYAAHWLGDNWSLWTNLHFSVIGIMQFNQFGIPFVGSDICGFIGNSSADLCQRWMQLGAFYPFSRNHNGLDYVEQDPAVWGSEVAESSKKALELRYSLISYLYTLFYLHNVEGSTVVRPLWHEFPADPKCAEIDRQFLWGSGLMVSPVLDQGATNVSVYFPNALFYTYPEGIKQDRTDEPIVLVTPKDKINLHVIGGNIIPTQDPAINTDELRKNDFTLIAALDQTGSANGKLYYDAGDSVDPVENNIYFLAEYKLDGSTKTFTANILKDRYPDMANRKIQIVRFFGVESNVVQVTLNDVDHKDFVYLEQNKQLIVSKLGMNANVGFTLKYVVE